MNDEYKHELSTPELALKMQVMRDFKVDEETAERIIAFVSTLALEKMKKWIYNTRRK